MRSKDLGFERRATVRHLSAHGPASLVITTQAHDARLREMRNGGDEAPPRHPWDALGKQEDGTVYKRVLRAVVKRLMRRHDLHEGDIVTKMEWDAAVNAVTFSG